MKAQQKRPDFWMLPLIGLMAVLVLWVAISQASNTTRPQSPTTSTIGSPMTESPAPQPSDTLSPTMTPEDIVTPAETGTENVIATTPEEMATPDETATQNAIATALQWKEYVAATAQQILTDQPIQNPPRPTGILETGGGDFSAARYTILNSWQNVRDNQWSLVYAGAYAQEPEQGIVIATGVPRDIVFETPVRAGSVRIIAEVNFRLTLLAEDSTIFYFDVPGLQFVDSLTQVVPTITPFMSATPTLTHTPHPTDVPLPTCTPGPTPTANPPIPFVCD